MAFKSLTFRHRNGPALGYYGGFWSADVADLFLSYRNTPARRAYVERLKIAFDAYSISAWWDYGLEAGRDFEPQIMAELGAAGLVCPLWCSESVRSVWVAKEAQYGLDHGKLLPARLEAVVPPQKFALIQSQDLVGWDGSVGNHMVIAFADAVARRLGRALAPVPDKLRALRALAPLRLLESNHDSVSAERWESLKESLDVRRLDIFIEETPPGMPERFTAREHKLQLEDWAKVDDESLEAIQQFLRTKPFPALQRWAHARANQAKVSARLSSFYDERMPTEEEEKLRHFFEGYRALFGLMSVDLSATKEAMEILGARIRGKEKIQILDLFNSILLEALVAACYEELAEVIISKDSAQGLHSPLRIYPARS